MVGGRRLGGGGPGGVPRARGRIGGAAARRHAAVSGDASPGPRAARQWQPPPSRPSRPPCVFVPCSLWFSLLPCFGVLVVDHLRSLSQTAVPRGTEQAGARLSPGWSASKRRGLCAVTPVLARESSLACGFSTAASTGRPQGHPVRRSVLSDGAWRTRVGARPRQRRRRRLTGPGSPVWRPSSSGVRLGASPDVPLLGAGGRSTSGGPVCSAPASLLSGLVRVGGQCPRARRRAWVQRVGHRLAGGRFRSWSNRFGGLVLPVGLRIAQTPAALDAVTGAFTSGSVGLTRVTGPGPGPHAQGSSCSTAKGRPISSTKLATPILLVQNYGRLGWLRKCIDPRRRLLSITCTFRLLAPSVRPPRVGRRCRRTTVSATCSDSGTRSRPRPWCDRTVPKSNSLKTARPSGNPCSTSSEVRRDRRRVTRRPRRSASIGRYPRKGESSLPGPSCRTPGACGQSGIPGLRTDGTPLAPSLAPERRCTTR